MRKIALFLILSGFFVPAGCQETNKHIITIENTLNLDRSFETVEINKSALKLNQGEVFENLLVKDLEANKVLLSQFVDSNLDGEIDMLLFQPEIGANATKKYELVVGDDPSKEETIDYCYSRFVPERTDDYAWENNKVAFRTFGPDAQYRFENNLKKATLSSGIDGWLKRVEYPIINKWYKNDLEGKGSYHDDHGEGLDNFHVGVSRGVGGIAVKRDTIFYISKNFTKWQTITTGPLRTSFILHYEDWDANGDMISEIKHISLDYGSNLSKFEIEITGTKTFHAGLTLHEKAGEDTHNLASGWVSYWQPHDDSELGKGIVVPNNNMVSSELYDTPVKDRSNLFAEIKVVDGKGVYYAGFGWEKANDFTSKEDWNAYLEDFSTKINNPLKVILN
ncbi:DUF4861 family protein [Cognatitamlana onchidii]|uniref:DUF4861 family protein n=1 Tax=Cognatitamlana onchidii TaxID=2562860 RepID=UPI0010A61E17|nr:DUF4861 family protein [Algibacter onchidii]